MFSKTPLNTPLCFMHARCKHHWIELLRPSCNSSVPYLVILGFMYTLNCHCIMHSRCKQHWIVSGLLRPQCLRARSHGKIFQLVYPNKPWFTLYSLMKIQKKKKGLALKKNAVSVLLRILFSHKECIDSLDLFWFKKTMKHPVWPDPYMVSLGFI